MNSANDSSDENLPEIEVDWNDMWGNDLVSIHLPCSIESFERLGITPREGLRIKVRQEDLAASAIIVVHQLYGGHTCLMAKLTEPLHEVPWG